MPTTSVLSSGYAGFAYCIAGVVDSEPLDSTPPYSGLSRSEEGDQKNAYRLAIGGVGKEFSLFLAPDHVSDVGKATTASTIYAVAADTCVSDGNLSCAEGSKDGVCLGPLKGAKATQIQDTFVDGARPSLAVSSRQDPDLTVVMQFMPYMVLPLPLTTVQVDTNQNSKVLLSQDEIRFILIMVYGRRHQLLTLGVGISCRTDWGRVLLKRVCECLPGLQGI